MASEMKFNDERRRLIVPILAKVLHQLCVRNDSLENQWMEPSRLSKFHALRPPPITIQDYLDRIAKYSCCSEECFVLALIYIDRLIQCNPSFLVNSLNVHRIIITSVMLAAKFFDDHYYNNAYYGKVGGVSNTEVNSLEIEFLFMVNFNLFVATDEYNVYNQRLMTHARAYATGPITENVISAPPQTQNVRTTERYFN